ncbi:spore germination protein [Fictibacillus barbaricus]|uniref:Spore germination protein KA n=1 Tax=Fictibacillus barbaricus TaxID=182136 RepID=A0ABU1TWK7_9BACL|nr:spore germination protein [Fictibacillus barbaricus]MDR7071572.1 spore germination protein KA [Fictibacillus barbaricus]
MVFKKRRVKKLLDNEMPKENSTKPEEDPATEDGLYSTLDKNISRIKTSFGDSSDLVSAKFLVNESLKQEAALIYIEGLVNKQIINHFLENITVSSRELKNHTSHTLSSAHLIEHLSLPISHLSELHDFTNIYRSMLSGNAVLLLDSVSIGYGMDTCGWKGRDVSESETESVVRGPKEAFTESIQTNTTLIRRKIKDPRLWIVTKPIGTVTQTRVSVVYIHGIANEKLVKEVHERLDRIDIDGILESNYIEEFIQDETYTPFPTVFNTERPDVIAAGLLEGRIAIVIDGTPFVLLVPALFTHFFQAAEDYYQRWDISTLLRILRVSAFFISLLGPSVYIAVINFHQEMLPSPLLVSLAAQREGVPFPAVIEALIMEITLEILREAGLRLPKAIGQTVSIVGALVIGQAAVEAGIISAAMVIVVSITAISNFILPAYNIGISIRILRFGFMILAGTFGLYGVAIGLFALALHLCSLRSFGIPYMAPIAPYIKSDMKDTLWRKPRWKLLTRPRLVNQTNINREPKKTSDQK